MKRLTFVRKSQDLSQAKVARAAELDQATVSRIENGRYVPYAGELARIALAMGWKRDPQELLDDVEAEYVERR